MAGVLVDGTVDVEVFAVGCDTLDGVPKMDGVISSKLSSKDSFWHEAMDEFSKKDAWEFLVPSESSLHTSWWKSLLVTLGQQAN